MPRSPRADEAGGLYHALNRGNLRATIFHKREDYVAFERILYEALEIHKIELYSYLLMPNHYHIVLRPLVDGEMSRFMGWVGGTHTMRYHAHYHTSGMGHVYQQRYKSFPIQDDDTSLLSVVTSSEMRCGPDLLSKPRIGIGVRYGDGFRLMSHCRGFFRNGLRHACPTG